MGGATVLMASGEPLPDNVVAIVDDSGYTSVWDIYCQEGRVRFGLPPFPIMYMISAVAKVRAGYGFHEASALKQVVGNRKPTLFLHGSEDTFVPLSMGYELYEANPSEKEMVVFPGVDHVDARYVYPEEYYGKVFEFVGRAMDGAGADANTDADANADANANAGAR
jgi:fermentation-respiration switch protein FrsA (DUF1100 family)